jgi:hypothetical protein
MTKRSGGLPAGLVKGVDPAKAGTAEMFARFLVPAGSPSASAGTHGGSGLEADSVVEPDSDVEVDRRADAVTLDEQSDSIGTTETTVDLRTAQTAPHVDELAAQGSAPDVVQSHEPSDFSDQGGALDASHSTPQVDASVVSLEEEVERQKGPQQRTSAGRSTSVHVKKPKPNNGSGRSTQLTRQSGVVQLSDVSGERRSDVRAEGSASQLPDIPPESSIPSRFDASYVPRQLFIRLPVELRDRLRESKAFLVGSGSPMTDGEIVEAGCRMLPTELDGMFHRCLNYAMRRERGAVPFSPQIRLELHSWLEGVNSCLRGAGLRVSVNTIALVALESFVEQIERR